MTPLVLALAAGAANLAGALVVVRGSRSGTRTIEGAIAFGAGFMVSVVMLTGSSRAFASRRRSCENDGRPPMASVVS